MYTKNVHPLLFAAVGKRYARHTTSLTTAPALLVENDDCNNGWNFSGRVLDGSIQANQGLIFWPSRPAALHHILNSH